MPGSEPGTPAQAVAGPDGTVTYVNPATSPAFASLPPGSPGALLLQGPQAPPPAPAQVRRVFTSPPVPGQPGRLVKLPGGALAVTPSGLAAPAALPPTPVPETDPPLGAQVMQSLPDGTIIVNPIPAGYAGADDAQTINAGLLQAAAAGGISGGAVRLNPATYTCNSSIVMPWTVSLDGQGFGTVLKYTGNAQCVFIQNPQPPQGDPFTAEPDVGGRVGRLVIDGAAAGASAIGLQIEDIRNYHLDQILVQNFSGANGIGVLITNNAWSANDIWGHVNVNNCANCVVFDNPSSAATEHINVNWHIHCYGTANGVTAQNGIVLRNAVNLQACDFTVTLTSEATAGAAYLLGANCIFQECRFFSRCEQNNAPGTAQTINFGAGSKFVDCEGLMYFGSPGYVLSNLTNQVFKFAGTIMNEDTLRAVTTPAVPAANATVTNAGPPVWVEVSGGAGVNVSIDGVATGRGSGGFYLRMDGVIGLGNYTSSPAWTWFGLINGQG